LSFYPLGVSGYPYYLPFMRDFMISLCGISFGRTIELM